MDVTKCSDTETLLMVIINAHSRTHESLFSCKFNLTAYSFPKSTFPTPPFFKIPLEIFEVIGLKYFPTHLHVVDIMDTSNYENLSSSIPVFEHKPLFFL